MKKVREYVGEWPSIAPAALTQSTADLDGVVRAGIISVRRAMQVTVYDPSTRRKQGLPLARARSSAGPRATTSRFPFLRVVAPGVIGP